MLKTIDLYLGAFLILCGFVISLINLRRVLITNCKYSSVLLSENIILMCIGIAFIARAVYSLNPENVLNMEFRTAYIKDKKISQKCGFSTLLLGYGPLIVSTVNSFLSLLIDNYMHYLMIVDIKKKDEENDVQEINVNSGEERSYHLSAVVKFFKQNFSYITIAFQWLIPIIIALSMYSVNVKNISMNDARKLEESCMTMLDMSNAKCLDSKDHNETVVYIQPTINHLNAYEIGDQKNSSAEINSILDSVFNIIKNFHNDSDFRYTSPKKTLRIPKYIDNCMEICIIDNKIMLIYMFMLAFLCYFIPITISTIILTKISILKTKKPHLKTYVTRELLYNVLFWTPTVFDTFLSLILCSFSMHGVRTSLFHVVANVYQAIRNFMNTKYFKENVIVPV